MKLRSIRAKFTISSAIVIATMILLIEVCIYAVAVEQQVKDSAQLYSELVDAMGKSFDDLFLSFKRGIDFITKNEDLQDTLQTTYADDESGELNVKLKVLLTNRALLMNEVDGLYLFDSKEELRTFWKKKNRTGEAYLPFPEMEKAWFLPTGKVSGRVIQNKLVFTRTIRSMKDLETIGYLIAVYDESELYNRVEGVVSDTSSSLIVFDEDGKIITHNYKAKEDLDKILREVDFKTLPNYEILTLKGNGKVIVSQYVSKDTGWRVVSIADIHYITRSSVFLRNLVFVLGILGVLGGTMIQWGLACRIVGPLNHMVDMVNHADKGDYSRRMRIQTTDELMILAKAFNHMMEETDILVNQVLRDEIKHKEMQLSLMQAQINPHMLYNTLECINWLAEFDRKEEIRQVTIAFSNLMKSLAQGRKFVKIEEEIAYVRDFLLIYQVLLEGKMEYQIEVDGQLTQIMIPRLIIQPLVENSVVHGIKKSLYGGKIHISIVPSNEGMLISVLDDGIGMPQEEVNRINQYAQNIEEKTKERDTGIGIGVGNVIERLQLVYGKEASFYLSSDPTWGTAVDIFIPLDQEEI